ncbi:hypothetical protein K1T71_013620 [Dendrolimus kikuchii]|uniref:Uncharacterized protein n=1 Tax=Dendrolimus kikuchii TaxID=765133 RepID=A0ACC1CH56_9NEOP|nr:hypothetical protein K1T71_013620 [Dendrolimus kikuchii]
MWLCIFNRGPPQSEGPSPAFPREPSQQLRSSRFHRIDAGHRVFQLYRPRLAEPRWAEPSSTLAVVCNIRVIVNCLFLLAVHQTRRCISKWGTPLSASDSNIAQSVNPEEEFPESNNLKRRRVGDKKSSDEFIELKQFINNLMLSQNKRLDLLENHIKEVKGLNTTLNTSCQEIEKSLNIMSDQMRSVETKIDLLESERKSMANHVLELEEKIDNLERNSVKTSIEIRNIPKFPQETKEMLYNMVQNLAQYLNINISKSDLRDVQRSLSKQDKKFSSVIVEFHNTFIMTTLLKEAKKHNKENISSRLNSSHIGLSPHNNPIYISEYLTAKSRRLFYMAREFAKKQNYAFCWCSKGRIYLRKELGSEYILIKHETRLEELKNKTK